MIGAKVKNNIQMFVHGVDKGVAVMKNAVKAQFQQITHTKRHVRNHFRHKPIPMLHAASSMVNYRTYGKPQPIYKPMPLKNNSLKTTATATIKTTVKPEIKYKYDKTGKIIEAIPPNDNARGGKMELMEFKEYKNLEKDMGVDGYKHFEDSVIRDLEKKEEKNVEATMLSKLNIDEVIKGKQFAYEDGWVPVTIKPPGETNNRQPALKSHVTSLHSSIKDIKPNGKFVRNESKQTANYKSAATTTKSKVLSYQKQKTIRKNVKKQETKNVIKHHPISSTAATTILPIALIPHKIDPKAPTDSDDGTGQPDYLQNIQQFLPEQSQNKQEVTPTTRNHIQSLTTRKPNPKYLKNNSFVAQETSLSKSVLPTDRSFVTQKPKRKPNNLTNASQQPATSVAPSVRPTSKFVDRPKMTGQRGSVKFGDKLKQA
jgi:hypothetical protein